MPKPETKLWHELKRITPQITWTRLENTSVFGTPDLLGYNTNQHFFTVELKVTRINSVRFSPHQIAFHKLHPKNSFILAKSLASSRVKLYEGSQIMELVACGLKLDACCLGLGLEACGLWLSELGARTKAAGSWSLAQTLVFWICDIRNFSVPAVTAALALIALVLGRAGLSRWAHSAGPRPPGRVFTVHHMARESNN